MATALERLRCAAPTLSVGLISADLLHLGDAVATLEGAGVELAHFDVMDGSFCPAMTIGPPLVKAVRTTMLKDVHLMVEEPLRHLDAFVAAGADVITVHVEAARHVHGVLREIGRRENANDAGRGIVRGVALNPGTPLAAVEPLLDEVELVLVLAVNPGFAGERFAPQTAARVAALRDLAAAGGRDVLIAVDGGITADNIGEVGRLEPDVVVTGSAVFRGDAAENARRMQTALERRSV